MLSFNNNKILTVFPYLIFFMSGSAALVFENLWFRLAGINVGNSVWGAAIVLAGFMGGLGLGNALIARYGHYIARPVYVYIILEFVIAVSGFSLIIILPLLTQWMAPVFRPFLDLPLLLNSFRLILIFALLLIPTTAMGATLPIMVKAVCNINKNFGSVLGSLYGWNTLGAVFGVLICEFFLIKWFGIRNAGFIAVMFNLIAIILAVRFGDFIETSQSYISNKNFTNYKNLKFSPSIWRLLVAAFLSGSILLALEVVWFRFLLLTISGTSVIFTLMLVIVLAGIGIGGLIASWMYKKQFKITNYSSELAIIGGILALTTYIFFDLVYYKYTADSSPTLIIFFLYSVFLMLPVSLVSGMLFTTLGKAIREILPDETITVGLLTLANTVGAMLGALLAGVVLLKVVGMEKSFWILAVCYGVVALIIPKIDYSQLKTIPVPKYILGTIFSGFIIFFPFGLMEETHFRKIYDKWGAAEVVDVKEGLVATNFYYLYKKYNEPYYYRLMTNGYSMSGTSWQATRYMKLFSYLPLAINPQTKDVLLISYGVGITAKALTDTLSLRTIDIVDISEDVLEMSKILYSDPEEHPLNDERVNVHIEDGRFYLQTTDKKFDLITGEPPPPKIHQVVNLYSQEYFQLIFDRLSEGGTTTYWLPVYQLHVTESKSIIKAFCNVFNDCSLWTGAGLEWILVGTKNSIGPGLVKNFSLQWSEADSLKELQTLGLEIPAQLGTLFLADSVLLKDITQDSLPLTDNYPNRLTTRKKSIKDNSPFFHMLMNTDNAKARFTQSEFIKKLWPVELRTETLEYFKYQRMINDVLFNKNQPDSYIFDDLYNVLEKTSLETLPLWILSSNFREQQIINNLVNKGQTTKDTDFILAKLAIAKRDYSKAIILIEKYMETIPDLEKINVYPLYLFTLCANGNIDDAAMIANIIAPNYPVNEENLRLFTWLHSTFGMPLPNVYIN